MKATPVFRLVFLVSMALTVSCSPNSSQYVTNNNQPHQVLESLAKDIVKKSEWVSFDCEFSSVDRKGIKYEAHYVNHLSYHYNDTFPSYYFTRDSMIYFKVSPNAVQMVNYYDNTLAVYHHVDDLEIDQCFRTWKSQIEDAWLGNISAFFQCAVSELPPITSLSFSRQSDTIIRGIHCIHVYGQTPKAYWRNGEAEGMSQCENHFWINKNTRILDSLTKIETADTTQMGTKETYIIKNIDFEDKSVFLDTVFDFDSPRYDRFSVMNEYVWLRSGTIPDQIEKDMFEFPLIDLHGDTCCLNEVEGWKLLHFWCFHCSQCIKQLGEWGKEKDSLGVMFLQNKGIKLLSINYKSNNFELLKQIASKTNSEDIVFSSKGIDEFIHIPALGYNYLISPNNEIVFQRSFIGGGGDYSELLEAKAHYEKQHQIK